MEDFGQLYQSINKTNFFAPIVNGAGNDTYPLVGLTYVILRTDWPESCSAMYELMHFFDWAMKDETASTIAEANFFHTLTPALTKVTYQVLSEITCSDGFRVFENLQRDRPPYTVASYIDWSERISIMPIILFCIGTSLVGITIILTTCYRKRITKVRDIRFGSHD